MPGRHTDPARSSVGSDLFRFAVLLAILAVVLIGGSRVLTNLMGSGGDLEATNVSSTSGAATTATPTVAPQTSAPQPTVQTSTTTSTATTTTETTSATTPSTTATSAVAEPPVALDPSEVSVLVLNSTSRSGLAARLVQSLDALGYQTPEPTNYQTPLDQSRVWYVEGFRLEAEAVALVVPDALVELTQIESPSSPVTVVLGASFTE